MTWFQLLLIAAALLLLLALSGQVRAQCTGDCDGSGEVTVGEIIVGVNIALDAIPLTNCLVLDADGNTEVTVDELIAAVGNALRGCPPGITPTPTIEMTETPEPTETPTADTSPTPTRTPPPGCGDGVVDFVNGETCDDGNISEGDDCPASCRIAPCTGTATMIEVNVSFLPPAGTDLAGITVFLRYPDGVVRIPGRANEAPVQDRVINLPDNTFSTPNDLDYGLRVVILTPDSSAIPPGQLFTVQFDTCEGAPPPGVGDFRCVVENAADTNNDPVGGTTCSVALSGGAAMAPSETRGAGYASGPHPDPPPCQRWHRGGELVSHRLRASASS
jgi:cysteine-rich repeat protein